MNFNQKFILSSLLAALSVAAQAMEGLEGAGPLVTHSSPVGSLLSAENPGILEEDSLPAVGPVDLAENPGILEEDSLPAVGPVGSAENPGILEKDSSPAVGALGSVGGFGSGVPEGSPLDPPVPHAPSTSTSLRSSSRVGVPPAVLEIPDSSLLIPKGRMPSIAEEPDDKDRKKKKDKKRKDKKRKDKKAKRDKKSGKSEEDTKKEKDGRDKEIRELKEYWEKKLDDRELKGTLKALSDAGSITVDDRDADFEGFGDISFE